MTSRDSPHLNGNRGQFLLTFGIIYFAIGLAYVFNPNPTIIAAMAWMPTWSTVQACGGVWMVAGASAIVFSFAPMPTDRFGFMALSGWTAAWAIAWCISQALGHSERGYASALIYCLLTRVVMIVSGMRNPVEVSR